MARKPRERPASSAPLKKDPKVDPKTSTPKARKPKPKTNIRAKAKPVKPEPKGGGGRRAINWEDEPYGVFVGSSPTAKESFSEQGEAVKFIAGLRVSDQQKAFIGRLKKVKIKTHVTI